MRWPILGNPKSFHLWILPLNMWPPGWPWKGMNKELLRRLFFIKHKIWKSIDNCMLCFSGVIAATTLHVPYLEARVQGDVVLPVQKENEKAFWKNSIVPHRPWGTCAQFGLTGHRGVTNICKWECQWWI